MSVRVSCPWCRQMQPIVPGIVSWCARCGHNPGVPLEACGCFTCVSRRADLPSAEGVNVTVAPARPSQKIVYGSITLEPTSEGLMVRLVDKHDTHNRVDAFIKVDSLEKAIKEVRRLRGVADLANELPEIPSALPDLSSIELPPIPPAGELPPIPPTAPEEHDSTTAKKKPKKKDK